MPPPKLCRHCARPKRSPPPSLQRLSLARTESDNEEARARKAAEDISARKHQITADIAREKQLLGDSEKAVASLAEEVDAIAIENAGEAPKIEQAGRDLDQARSASETAEQALADAAARSRFRRTRSRRRAPTPRRSDAPAGNAEASLSGIDLSALEDAARSTAATCQQAEANARQAANAKAEAEAEIETGRAQLNAQLAERSSSQENFARARAEADALQALLRPGDADDATPVSTTVSVAKGLEDALAAVLGDGLAAPVGKHRNGYWSNATSARPTCPDGAEPLASQIDAPEALAVVLAGVGIVASDADAEAMQASLTPGQALTTRDGGLWRWDGFVLPHGSETAAAQRLRQEARLRELTDQLGPLETEAEASAAKVAALTERLTSAEASTQALRASETEANAALNNALRAEERARDALAAGQHRHAEVTESLAAVSDALADARLEADQLDDTAALHDAVTTLSLAAEEKRQALADAMGAERSIRSARALRDKRQTEISREQTLWQERQNGANQRLDELNARMATAITEEENLAGIPEQIDQQRAALADTLASAETARRDAGDQLAEAETKLHLLDAALRDADQDMAKAREEAIRQEAQRDLARQHQADIIARIKERLNAGPNQLAEMAGLKPDEVLDTSPDSLAALEQRYERLIRERETVGPVNLRAEEEMQEVEDRITSLEAERDDLIAAIAKLRTAINQLNREGRERLLKSFAEVNRYFGALFNTLFHGGTAELSLTEAEDPLDAGLEILASPPGKKLQSLSLLSGGEKALTAIALIFAVFLTNPSPICILDEVDAPLDDSNVARFCDILAQIAEKTGTRFIVVTHHRLTMARMDRLYGVTMEQKGVSRVVSVDLQAAERFEKTA